ncbi:stage II sporulation protein M [Flavihumibacter stibioxidans]|nr:stage II sporulation protein M [Flavihumibacter stibioxidans]
MDKWKQIQQEPASSPDEMARQFTELVNDLGYAKTFYPRSKVTEYLNGLASRIYLTIYRNKKEEKSRILHFWKTELPLTIRRYHRELLYSFCIFLLFAIMAAFSAAQDETFVRGVLGNAYVEMTEDNIEKGDPFGVYKGTDEWSMFLQIALNNIRVSFMVFVSGVFAGIGTVYMLFSNGMMLGSFQYYFFAKGLGWPSVLVIWIHGTLEISAIIIAGAAGFVIAGHLLFPGTYTRLQSLMTGAKNGLKIMIGLVPVFIVAAFFEGFITRHSTMPAWLSIGILLLSLFFIIWYFVWYPISLSRKMKNAPKLPVSI